MRWLGVPGFAVCLVACAPSVEVSRTCSPADAMSSHYAQMAPVGIVRGDDVIAIPASARVEADKVVWPNPAGDHVHKLGPGDVIQTDSAGRIVAVRTAGPQSVVTRFVPGSAFSLAGSDEVRGRLEGPDTSIPLAAGDRIELRGRFNVDEDVPGGGRVTSSRSTGSLVGGLVLFALSYAPNAYVAATSKLPSDHVLWVPVAGPWIDLATRPKCVPPAGSQALPIDPCIVETVNKVGLVAGGAVEALGAILVAVGLPSSSRVEYSQDRGVARVTAPTWTVVPHAGPNGASVSATGVF